MSIKKILIADDDNAFLTAISTRLRADGFETVTVQDGYQAVEYARKHEPDLIVLDINMPAGDGFSVHERLGKMANASATPVIYVSGDPSDLVCETARQLSAGMLRKPFETEELIGLVRKTLSMPESEAKAA